VWNWAKAPLGAAAKAGAGMIGSQLMNMVGKGAYTAPWKVSANDMVTTEGREPFFKPVEGGFQIRHMEPMGPVYSSTGWTSRSYQFNVGLDTLSPWMAQIAAGFQKWRLDGAMVLFKSSIAAGTSTFASLGNLMLVHYLNPDEAVAKNQMEAECAQFCCSTRPSEDVTMPIECALGAGAPGSLNVRTGDLATGVSLSDYDHGILQVATVGQPSAGVLLGNLYIELLVTLISPIWRGAGNMENMCHYTMTGVIPAKIMGTAHTKVKDTIGATFSDTVLTLPYGCAGNFVATYVMGGTGTAMHTFTVTYSNASALPFNNGSSTPVMAPQNGATGVSVGMLKFAFTVADPTMLTTITLASDSFPGSGAADCTAQLYIYQVLPGTLI